MPNLASGVDFAGNIYTYFYDPNSGKSKTTLSWVAHIETKNDKTQSGFNKFGVYDAIGFGADMAELYRQGNGAVQFGMSLGKAEKILNDSRILSKMSSSRQVFNNSVKAFKTGGRFIAGLGLAANAAEFIESDMSGGDIAKLAGGVVITATAFIPVVGPFISVGLGLLDSAGAFDALYQLAD
ncbi:MAG: hypothetical protein O9340_11150 [Cyclobacteriaceae bacterium]|jgi:hypothetical protein|nr:hypothetical protein [Cyclobacteriaceae bacterium]